MTSWRAPQWAVEAYDQGFRTWPIKVVGSWVYMAEKLGYNPNNDCFKTVYLQALAGEIYCQQLIDKITAYMIKQRMLK